jgi:hypothetical protein
VDYEIANVTKELEELRDKARNTTIWDSIFGTRDIATEIANASIQLQALQARRDQLAKQQPTPGTPGDQSEGPDLSRMKEQQELAQNQFQIFQQQAAGQRTLLEDLNMAFTSHADLVVEAQSRIAAAYGNTVQAQIQMANIQRQLNLQQEQQVIRVAQTAAQTITALWPKQKGAAIAAATINTGVAVTEALKLTFPLNFIQAGLVLAAGVAQINAIRSTSQSGGGSLPALSGGGGGGAIGDTGGATPVAAVPDFGRAITIVLEGDFYSRDQVQSLMDRISEEVKNGGKLVSSDSQRRLLA